MKIITITSDKGGVGKSTIATLIIEWLNHNNIPVDLTDADPIQTTKTWSDNCKSDGRNVLSNSPKYLVVDTAGTFGAGLSWLKKSDIIVAPFQPHYADIQTVLNWFCSIDSKLQKKVKLVPNRYQKTNEQKEGIAKVMSILEEEKSGVLMGHLSNKPAVYGALLNGSPTNFFSDKKEEDETIKFMRALFDESV